MGGYGPGGVGRELIGRESYTIDLQMCGEVIYLRTSTGGRFFAAIKKNYLYESRWNRPTVAKHNCVSCCTFTYMYRVFENTWSRNQKYKRYMKCFFYTKKRQNKSVCEHRTFQKFYVFYFYQCSEGHTFSVFFVIFCCFGGLQSNVFLRIFHCARW